ncbi:MAG: hypothetical protein WDN00_19405 [Limisphaerales bacterium]
MDRDAQPVIQAKPVRHDKTTKSNLLVLRRFSFVDIYRHPFGDLVEFLFRYQITFAQLLPVCVCGWKLSGVFLDGKKQRNQ